MPTDSSAPLPLQTIELVRRARAGERAAVDELFDRYAARVRGLVAVRMGQSLVDLADRDDVVQEALVAAFRGLDRFESQGEGSFVCWLASVVHSRIANLHRSAAAEKRGGGRVRRQSELGRSTLSAMPPSRRPSPSAIVAAGELDEHLERALLALPETQRQIVYCRTVLEMEFAEIAAALGSANVDSVRAQFHKATRALRERLG